MRRRRNRSTWFPILGFSTQAPSEPGLQTVDVRELSVDAQGNSRNTAVIPLIPDIDIPTEISNPSFTTLRDLVEGQSCIIDRVVGTIQLGCRADNTQNIIDNFLVAAGIAIVPTEDDGTGNPAVDSGELDPFRADNSANPWMWRRVWALSNPDAQPGNPVFPQNNIQNASFQEGTKVDTKGVKRAIRREERIFLIVSTQVVIPSPEGSDIINGVIMCTDLRVLGRMVKARNRSNFK